MWRLRPDVLVAAAWAAATTLVVRRQLQRSGTAVRRPWAPRLPARAGLGVQAVLTRLSPTCLERAVVAQAWAAAQGAAPDIVIGIPLQGMADGRVAHAWLDGRDAVSAAAYRVIHRLPADRAAVGARP